LGGIRGIADVSLALIVPGALDQLTGGYLFARHIVEELRAGGEELRVIELDGVFPAADAIARHAASVALASLADGTVTVIDGLGLVAFADCLAAQAARLTLLGFVHHPLAEETGLTAEEAARFRAAETRLLPLLRGAVCPSRMTAQALIGYGMPPERIAITPPGTAKPMQIAQRDPGRQPLRLLAVATVTPRKGHRVLIDALAALDRKTWQLDCIGSLTRDAGCAAELRAAIAAHGLADQVRLLGEWPPTQLPAAYDNADIFVLPSFHEGYGMALAEALAHGLPIVATRAGAIPETVPSNAGILVPAGDVTALRAALRRLIDDRALLAALGQAARAAGAALPGWPQAVARWRAAVTQLAA
jgi:glycosyltransferase involved in cell wall biosynthesis